MKVYVAFGPRSLKVLPAFGVEVQKWQLMQAKQPTGSNVKSLLGDMKFGISRSISNFPFPSNNS